MAARLDALGGELRDPLVDPVRGRRDRDAGTIATQGSGDRETDPVRAAGAGDQGDAAGEA